MDTEKFRLERVADMERVSDRIYNPIARALRADDPAAAILSAIRPAFTDEMGSGQYALFDNAAQAWDWFADRITPGLAKATGTSSARRIADWLGTAIVNASRVARTDYVAGKMWLSRRDDRVRDTHRIADGQRQPWERPFSVCGQRMMFPGDPVGDPDCWINCRCVAMPTLVPVFSLADDDPDIAVFAEHDLVWVENRRTPKVMPRGKRYTPKPSEGRIVKRRKATADEERTIRRGDWVRVNRDGKKPGQPGYMDRKSKVRPQNNALEDTMDTATFTVDEELDVQFEADDVEFSDEPVPFWAVLAPEGVWSGDKRRFAEGALTNRDLPLPLMWQRQSGDGHSGSVVVGNIASIEREGNLMVGTGTFAQNEDADEVVGLLAEGHLRGISVDVDDAEMEMSDDPDTDGVTFSRGRISAATIVPIPAFAEAVIRLGVRDTAADEALAASAVADFYLDLPDTEFVVDKEWDGSSGRFTPEQWKRSCVLHTCDGMEKSCHKLPIREPGGAINRRAVHNAAARFNQVDAPADAKRAAAARLRSAYREIGEEPPEVLTASVEFKRGAGWVTHPRETSRLHRYWTKGKGAAKIGWGRPHDFYRCRRQLAKYIEPQWLNRTCAQWHKDALGYWPGEHGGTVEEFDCDDCTSVSLVAAAVTPKPAEAFTDPHLDGPTALTLDGDRVYGHLALWDTCHVGIGDVCVTPPHSASNYAWFLTGLAPTTDGPVPVGQITLTGGHADLSLDPFATKAHYDNTDSAVADVTVGEDEHGIWFSGLLRDGVTEEQVHTMLAQGLSGDWRGVRGNLELVAALSVPVPGFPVPRVSIAASGGVQTALVRPAIRGLVASGDITVTDLAGAVVDEMEARAARREHALAVLDKVRKARAAAVTRRI